MKIILIRHGQTQWNLQQRMQGSGNSDLTEKGIQQAKHNGTYLSNKFPDISSFVFLASPLGRAQQTANIILNQLDRNRENFITEDALREKSFGVWEGKTQEEITQEYPEEFLKFENDRLKATPPQGESEPDLSKRIKQFHEDLDPSKNYIMITHYYFSRSFQQMYLNNQQKKLSDYSHSQDTIIILENNSINILSTTPQDQ